MKGFVKTSIIALAASSLVAVSCAKWTQPESLDFRRETPEQIDPAGYETRLKAVREWKRTVHNITIATISGTSSTPSFRWQHPKDIPDSVDFICIKDFSGLHESLADELAYVREKKGTASLAYIDYSAIAESWSQIEDENEDSMLTDADRDEYFKENVAALLDSAEKSGFDGLMVSVEQIEYASDDVFISAVKSWKEKRPDAPVVLRGYAKHISDTEFASSCAYYVVVAGELSSPGQLILETTRCIGSVLPSDRVLLEVSVPSSETPEQTGIAPEAAAEWVLAQKDNRNFTPQGIVFGNAEDDYWRNDRNYGSLRTVIEILNPQVK